MNNFIADKESKAMCLSSDPDKDVDSVTGPELDVASCRRAFQYLAKVSTKRHIRTHSETYNVQSNRQTTTKPTTHSQTDKLQLSRQATSYSDICFFSVCIQGWLLPLDTSV